MAGKPARDPAKEIITTLASRKMTMATAESCTAGLLSGAITDVPGASAVFYGGFITYSNAAKSRMIGVPARMIEDHGAVSAQVARAMADGARNTARTDIAVSVTGIAGPDGGSERKPVGLVYFAVATKDGTDVLEKRFGDIGREGIRKASVEAALEMVLETLGKPEEL
ncbi:competence damage-inducible protein A [Youhaiella tibetensis]|uniref:CinA family protein n=1 Tax=Paradevosia tibetensis TaxID=1447062 RepID=A0A5B9DMS3_9HYPH|nr:nicotinamide-nucleotide amidohydrolase family protein [Youhaiella tibetensis]AKR55500.1 damage-inducible protein CinA [Devosia sp. H5989]QEE20630.1 CinA family protein [Youhaiella tibetensis]GGF22481.1 competence damage-inducible protein A [Youhaiella tibetensis]